jgi:1-deoxy-D-xylulose-5-phosphate synthase
MMELAIELDGPVAIRFPRGSGVHPDAQLASRPFGVGEAELVADGSAGCLIAYGPMTYVALEVRRRIAERMDRQLAVVDARFAKPLDSRLIGAELERQPVVFTLEDHVVAGGFGSAVSELALAEYPGRAARLELLALPDRFIDHGERTLQLASAGLDVDQITERVARRLETVSMAAPVRLVTGK